MRVRPPVRSPALPHPAGRVPVLGDFLTLNLRKPTQQAARDAQRLGPIFERRIFTTPVIVVSGAELIAEINDDQHWRKHVGAVLEPLRSIVHDGLITARDDEPNWARAHAVLAPGFSRDAMRRYHPTMTAVITELLDHWGPDPGLVDITAAANRMTLEIIGRAGFGYSFGSLDRTDHRFVTAMTRGLHFINTAVNVPSIVHRTVGRRRLAHYRRDIAYVNQVIDDVIAARGRDGGDGQHDDLLDLMLTTADPASGEHLDPVNIRHQCLTMLVAGHETSAGTIAFALHELARNPEVAARARAELYEHFPGPGRPAIGFDDAARLRYLRRIVDETLRLHPIAPGYFREPIHDTVIGGQHRFMPGDWVFVLTLAAHRDPDAWGPDAGQFDPDRWLPDRIRQLGNHIYKPFGTGPRACLGRQFALHETVLALAHLLHSYDIRAMFGDAIEVHEQVTLKPRGLRLRLTNRR
ncbi:cytochrome P450 [Nocardia wallacei]|uniref:cytochrome P450 n=1 Tax=Nocardia wallacei TaxID=480035 RepID=UPI002456E7EA|nr:cytochrome P450 [Nocardia wallacei]